MTIAIENPKNVDLSAELEAVLREMFAGYRRVIVRKAFGQGLSGGQVLEVRPVKADGIPELPAVVKLATISLIQKEWEAYQQHIRYRLPNVTEVTAAPVLLPQVGWGGLRYTLLGSSGTFEVMSLNDYLRRGETTVSEIEQVGERLFRVMHHLWGYQQLEADFSWQGGYDGVLPVNLRLEQQPEPAGVTVTDLTPESLPSQPLVVGEWVRVSGFVLHKSDPTTQTMTLNRPSPPAYYLRCKVRDSQKLLTHPANHVVELLVGWVVETRLSRLIAEIKQAFGEEIDPTSETVLLPGCAERLVNPLCHLTELLAGVRGVRVSSVHGDFNLENILIEPETSLVSLIDFAEARTDHVLHDLLRLETEVITKLLPELILAYELPPLPTLARLYWQLHQATFAVNPLPAPHPALDKVWVTLTLLRRAARRYCYHPADLTEYYQSLVLYLLGALKFKNLSTLPTAPLPKQVAFWGATLIYTLLTEMTANSDPPPVCLAALLETALPEITVPESQPTPLPATLTEAERRLAALPLESIPTLGPLPPHSRMPLSRNPLFVGREADLKKLAQTLKGQGTVAIGAVETMSTTGLGGLGKTQLASEFVHRYGRFFAGGVFWLSFADPKAVPAEIAACGGTGTLNLRPNFGELALDEQVRLVQAAWQEPLPRLLIFDNCEDPDLLARWRPTSGGCRVLVTSRRADWEVTLGVQTLPLGVLKRWESIALLREHQPDAEDEILDAIAAELGDLPLALHLAGSYLARYRRSITPAQYLAQLRDPALLQHRSLKSHDLSPTDHLQNVYRTIALSYDQLNPDEPLDH